MEEILMSVRELDRAEVISQAIGGLINGTDASKMLGLSKRHIRRLKARVRISGIRSLAHSNRGRPSNRKISDDRIKEIELIVRDKYYDFGPTLVREHLEEDHNIIISKEMMRLLMVRWGLWKINARKANNEFREWRERKESYGEMEQFDGSYHLWFEDRGPRQCLLASIDDAKGEITKAEFTTSEGVIPVFTFWKDYVETTGKPISIYLDRHSTYKKNHKGILDEGKNLTQFERAMEELRIDVIHAKSPQGKGRIERLFETLQDRLVKELRLQGISTVDKANKFLIETYIPNFNLKFAVVPQNKSNLHRSLTEADRFNLVRTFSVQNKRVVNNDFTVRFKNKWYQLTKDQPTLVLRRDSIMIEERLVGKTSLSLRGKELNYNVLSERPKKEYERITALYRKPREHAKPSQNHPWRRPFKTDNQYSKRVVVGSV